MSTMIQKQVLSWWPFSLIHFPPTWRFRNAKSVLDLWWDIWAANVEIIHYVQGMLETYISGAHIQVDHILVIYGVIYGAYTVVIVTMESEVQVTGMLASPCIHVNLSPKGFEFQNVFLNVAAHCFVYPWDQNVTFECHLSISCMTLDCLYLHPNPPCSTMYTVNTRYWGTFTSLKPEKQVLSIHLCMDRMSLSESNPTWMSLNRMSAVL